MIALLRALLGRVQALLATRAAPKLKSEFQTRRAEHQAQLLRRAQWYEQEGLHGIAAHLRRRAEALDRQQPRVSPAWTAGPQILPFCNNIGGKP
jgi:hypothetical protein